MSEFHGTAMDGLREAHLRFPRAKKFVLNRMRYDQFFREVVGRQKIIGGEVPQVLGFAGIQVDWDDNNTRDVICVITGERIEDFYLYSPKAWRASEVTCTVTDPSGNVVDQYPMAGTTTGVYSEWRVNATGTAAPLTASGLAAMRAAYEACVNAKPVETQPYTPPSLTIERQNVLASKMSTLKRELWRIGKSRAVHLREWPVCKQTGNPMPMSVLIYDGGSRVMVTIECQHGDCESFQIGTAAPEHLTRAWKALDTTDAIRATEVDT